MKHPFLWFYGVSGAVGVNHEQTNAYIALKDKGTGQIHSNDIGFLTDSLWCTIHDLAFQLKGAALEELRLVVFVDWWCATLTYIL